MLKNKNVFILVCIGDQQKVKRISASSATLIMCKDDEQICETIGDIAKRVSDEICMDMMAGDHSKKVTA